MSTISELFTAAQTKDFYKPGKFFKLFRTSYPVDVRFYLGGQELKEDALQVEAGFGITISVGFDRFTITSAQAQTVTWFISNGNVNYDRTVGAVEVLDGGRARTVAQVAFMAGNYLAAGGAGNFTEIQLLNPVGSAKIVTLKGLSVGSSVAGLVQMSQCDVALSTLVGNAPNKSIGGAASSAQVRNRNNSAALAGTGNNLITFGVVANQSAYWPLQEPIQLGAGEGVEVYATAGNNLGWATFEFLEEAA